MRSYPIWNSVTACIYKSDKSYGAQNESTNRIYVGSSKNNSHKLATITTKKHILNDQISFELSVNGKIINVLKFENNNGIAGKLIQEKTL
jgi:hypothetical protein|tara:strand:+ start:201 stop:470 length:270 start_codon:yes stop_codon:yes gene_type:complete